MLEKASSRSARARIDEPPPDESGLSENERWLRAIFEQAAVGVAQVENATGRYVRVNRRYCQIAGRTADEMLATTFMAITHPDDLAADLAHSRQLREGRVVEYFREKRYLRADGAVVWVKLSVTPMWLPGQQPDYQIAVVEDITERKAAEDQLRASEERLRLALEAGRMGLWQWDPRRNRSIWNPREYELLGLPAGDGHVDSETFFHMIHPGDRSRVEAEILHCLATGADLDTEMRIVRSDGQTRWLAAHGRVYRDEASRPLRMVGVNYDITERKAAEESLRASRQMLETVINNIPQGVFWKDRNSLYLGGNRIVLESHGMQLQGEIVGKSDYQLAGVTRAEAAAFIRRDRDVMDRDAPQLGIIEPMTRADGSTMWLETSKLPLHDAAGVVIGVLGTWQDITQRRQMEEQLRQSQKMEAVGRLAGGIAHDFNNLLTVILGYSEMLLAMLPAPAEHLRDSLEAVRDAGDRAAALTRQLLAFSRKQVLEPRVLNLNEVVTHTEKLLRRLIGENIVLGTVLADDLDLVRVDPGQMEQVLMNLVVNGRDAMPGGGRLTIETRAVDIPAEGPKSDDDCPPGRYVQLSVSDTGAGMTPEVKARIFEPFFTTKQLGQGTGLGLSTVYGIVKQSGGRIAVYSEPGIGSAFHIYLPAVTAAPAPLALEDDAIRGGTETVLLVEDEQAVRALVRMSLEKRGYKVLEAASGREALDLAALHGGSIELLVSDVVMPEMSGPELVAALGPLRPAMKILLVSGYTEDAMVRHGIAQAKANFLQKPFTLGTLARKVREVLDRQP
jgi:PAS domain S-box-containing protein